MYTFGLSICILLALAGCEMGIATGQQYVASQTPAVKAWNGGSADLTIIACTSPSNATYMEEALARFIVALQTVGIVVSGNNGSAKLTINLCPNGG